MVSNRSFGGIVLFLYLYYHIVINFRNDSAATPGSMYLTCVVDVSYYTPSAFLFVIQRKSEVRYEPPILGKREDIDIMNRAGFKLEMLVSKQKVFHHLMGSAQLNKKAA